LRVCLAGDAGFGEAFNEVGDGPGNFGTDDGAGSFNSGHMKGEVFPVAVDADGGSAGCAGDSNEIQSAAFDSAD